ncbi:hypothetical protein B0J17DRAFT_629404 [Rhizoctonia solani]|nr:hypothetical protein B0J17DRAFT_629404 [Rhizoctonia solani]
MPAPSQPRSPRAGPSFPLFARAMSPALLGNVLHAPATTERERVAASAHARSWTEVLDCVPVAYREALRASFKDLHSRAVKYHAADAAHDRLRAGLSNQKPPPPVQGLHEPHWQVSKEFSESSPELLSDIKASYEMYVEATWKQGVELKRQEVEFLAARLTTEKWWPQIREIADSVYKAFDKKAPVMGEVAEGQTGVTGYADSEILKAEHASFIERARVAAEALKLAKKAELKATADVEMSDGTSTSNTVVKAMVQAEVRKILAQNPKTGAGNPANPKGKGKATGGKVRIPKGIKAMKGKVGHTDPKTGLAAPLHYGPGNKKRQPKKNAPKQAQAGSSKQSK